MEHSTNKLEYKVGVFIAMGLVAVMVTILLLGADKTFFTKYVHVKGHFTEVSGLFPGSVVSLAGVPVGNVDAIDFVAENKLEVDMKIDAKFAFRLVKGTVAEIRTQGALGDKFMYLIPGPDPQAPKLEDGALIEVTEQDLMKLLTSREDGVARVVDLIKEVHILVASLNQNGNAGVMMKNMTEASAKLKSTLTQIDGLMGDLRGDQHGNLAQNNKLKQSVASLASILEKIDQGKGSLGQLINDPAVHQSLKAFLGQSPRNTYMKNMLRESLQPSK